MRESVKQPRILLAFAGVLALLATLALGAATMRPTEATWQDTVHGESVFGADPAGIKSYARAISGNGVIKRPITSDPIGPARAVANPTNRSDSARLAYDDSGAFDVLPLEMSGNACAGVGAQQAASCGATATVPPAGSFAKSDVRNLKLWAAGIRGVQNVTFESSSSQAPITATATCVAGQTIEPRVSAGGPILLRGRTPLYLPPANRQTSATDRGFLSHNISGVLQVHQSQGPGWAKVEVRLHVENVYPLSDWTLHVVLASAECGIAQDMPAESPRPTTARPKALAEAPNQPATATFASRTALRMTPEVEPTVESTTVLPTEDRSAIGGRTPESELPTLDDAANDESARETDEDSGVATTTGATPSPTTSTPAKTTATATSTTSEHEPSESQSSTTASGTSEPATSESPDPTAVAEPTEQSAVPEGPQQPESVRVGREFTVVNRDGVELGRAKVEDIVRTPGCGVELTLSITTSAEAGPDRWASVGPDDFAEVRAGETTRGATRLSSDCEHAADSRTTDLSPGRDYEIVIAFQLDDSAQRAMLQPDGTAGWIFDLPPLTRVTATTEA
ncbi:hypothetical protein [Dietzia sp. B32]|uniref:hypothetical protein n=1 Tax=Dietzia sp. B32 TaxID=2915130 RepID=UPI0021ADB358|nr:hypothetical protein [Dietzia sp. B32]UVE96461.1 hypothetical protein L8M95_06760 [Dietzia sp. B32]